MFVNPPALHESCTIQKRKIYTIAYFLRIPNRFTTHVLRARVYFPNQILAFTFETLTPALKVKCGRLDLQQNRAYILSRIFEYGDAKALKWALRHFSQEDMKKVLRNSRNLSPKSGNFWALFFNLKKLISDVSKNPLASCKTLTGSAKNCSTVSNCVSSGRYRIGAPDWS